MSVRSEVRDGIALVLLDRPASRNAFDLTLVHELERALTSTTSSARCVVVGSTGPDFSVGGDIRGFHAVDEPARLIAELATRFHAVVRAVADSPVPVVAAVAGWAAGAGLSLVAACDLVVGGEDAGFRTGYCQIGLTPDGGMSWSLPRRVGPAVASDMLLTGRALTAVEARNAGLIARVTATDPLEEAVRVARVIADGPPVALAATRRLLREASGTSFGTHLDAEAVAIVEAAGGDEAREGLDAFVQRRSPVFA